MALLAIVGTLGAGKTLTLTYYASRDFCDNKKIYANYKLNFKYSKVTSMDQIVKMTAGSFFGDELWYWLDSRTSQSIKNRAIADIIRVSRKRGYDIYYTTQHLNQIDKRVRQITDYIAHPQLSKDNSVCKVTVMHVTSGTIVDRFRFLTAPVFKMYDTNEEVEDVEGFDKEEYENEQDDGDE